MDWTIMRSSMAPPRFRSGRRMTIGSIRIRPGIVCSFLTCTVLIYYTIPGQYQFNPDTDTLPHPYYLEEGVSFSQVFGSLAKASSNGTGDDGGSSRTAVAPGRSLSESMDNKPPPRDRWLLGVRRPPPVSLVDIP